MVFFAAMVHIMTVESCALECQTLLEAHSEQCLRVAAGGPPGAAPVHLELPWNLQLYLAMSPVLLGGLALLALVCPTRCIDMCTLYFKNSLGCTLKNSK